MVKRRDLTIFFVGVKSSQFKWRPTASCAQVLIMKLFVPGFAVLLALLLVTIPGPVRGQDADAPAGMTIHRDVEYANVDGKSLKLDLYLPTHAGKPFPVLMWIHGGGWQAGGKGGPMTRAFAYPLVQSGFALASIEYRLSQEAIFPAQIHDCKAAVRWLRANAVTYGIDPSKIAAGGDSAGGHLAALLGTTGNHPELEGNEGNLSQSSAVQAVCDFYGPADFLNWYKGTTPTGIENPNNPIAKLIGGPVSTNPDKARAASPITYVSAQSCPFFIAHGDEDHLVPLEQSVLLNDALQKAGVSSTLYVSRGSGHGFYDIVSLQHAFDFLKQNLQKP
jgi:acetyl esterase/lipase